MSVLPGIVVGVDGTVPHWRGQSSCLGDRKARLHLCGLRVPYKCRTLPYPARASGRAPAIHWISNKCWLSLFPFAHTKGARAKRQGPSNGPLSLWWGSGLGAPFSKLWALI